MKNRVIKKINKMKKIISIIFLSISFLNCKSQTPIVSIDKGKFETIEGAYFKDLNNELDKFEGTWMYTNNSISFILILEKKEQIPDGEYFEDILVGEYQYINNGVEVINTIPELIQSPDDIDNRNIGGNHIIPIDLFAPCDDCSQDERRVKLYFIDPERSYLSVYLILRYLQDANQFGQEAQMTATIVPIGGGSLLPNPDSPREIRVPYGEYLMIKQ